MRGRDRGPISRRAEAELPFFRTAESGPELLLDTCVYVDRLQGKLPFLVEELLDTRTASHSTVGIVELMHAVGRLEPHDPRTRAAVAAIRAAVKLMPAHRLFEPDADTLGRAAILAGILSRTQGYRKDDRFRALNDCTLFLQAVKFGLVVLTRNVRDFDLLMQIVPTGRVLFYRQG